MHYLIRTQGTISCLFQKMLFCSYNSASSHYPDSLIICKPNIKLLNCQGNPILIWMLVNSFVGYPGSDTIVFYAMHTNKVYFITAFPANLGNNCPACLSGSNGILRKCLLFIRFRKTSRQSIHSFLDCIIYRSITVTSWFARWCLKSLASRLFAQLFVQAQMKENIKVPR